MIALLPRITDKISSWPRSSDDCWQWIGALSLGSPKIAEGKTSVNAAGLLFKMLTGLFLGHGHSPRCHNGRCVNPFHRDIQYFASVKKKKYPRKSPVPFRHERRICTSGKHWIEKGNVIVRRKKGKIIGRTCRICLYRRQEQFFHVSREKVIVQLETTYSIQRSLP